jgi:hypothetical protein
MPELAVQSTSPSAPAPPPVPPGCPAIPPELDPPPAVPPMIDPREWEDYPIFRETFLLYVSEPRFNAALRMAGEMFFSMLLETYGDWPEWPESSTRTELRAAVADLRHLQGFLANVGQERHSSTLSPGGIRLSKHASRVARLLNQVATTIERKLAKEGAAS